MNARAVWDMMVRALESREYFDAENYAGWLRKYRASGKYVAGIDSGKVDATVRLVRRLRSREIAREKMLLQSMCYLRGE